MPTTPHESPRTLSNLREVGGDGLQARLRPGRRRVFRANTETVPADAYPSTVSHVVDLRRADEAEATPHPLAGMPGYVSAPLFDPSSGVEADPAALSLEQQYDDWIERHSSTIAEALRAVARTGGDDTAAGAGEHADVLICCAAGKDRTGVMSLLLASVWGADDSTIAADYAATGPNLRERFARELAESTDREHTLRMHRCVPEIAEHLLATLEERHGGARGYLRAIGLTDDEVAAL
ncbi:tyrosine-protein phosphatase [Frondihabitans australicus]|uniref:Protein-tyrosine phosphatase n=1 Tax=Frondihabitans australicus TaxID=386892 RepID=A0A495IBU4_9MICO|nr:tyrosine-protein phosphatase [Frondihabitans australicus]RKR73467.1 protein-tyrosine phosphatase [Frondihabitans australicus]